MNQPIPYTRFDTLVDNDCESGLNVSSDEESENDINNEESGSTWSDNNNNKDDDSGEFFVLLLIVFFFLFSNGMFMSQTSPNKVNDKFLLILFSPILLLTIITVGMLICKNKKGNVYSYSLRVKKQGYIAHDV